jgi:hypothetical protein
MADEKNIKELQHISANPIASNSSGNGGRKQNHQTLSNGNLNYFDFF